MKNRLGGTSVQQISVIVPKNPFVRPELRDVHHCLCALDVAKFYPNREDIPESDGSHRNRANYADHLNAFPQFKPLSEEYLAHRIHRISEIQFSAVPIPNADNFPDIDSVQILAYHRIVKFRKVLDDILGAEHRFWAIQRNPPWRPKGLTFEVVEPEYTAIYAGRA